ncbi:MAG: hypothetical protein HQK89_00710 [Nitrospirae bacterium]|nr:hypothetical protein [Nitrospirota bacterium]
MKVIGSFFFLSMFLGALTAWNTPFAYGDVTANCDNLTNTGLPGVSVDVLKLPDGTYRAYYMGMGGMVSARSNDGIVWTQETGQRMGPGGAIVSVSNPWVFITKDNRYRMIYEGHATPGNTTSNAYFYSAVSTDGLNFSNEGQVMSGIAEDVMSQTGFYFLSVPDGIRLSDNSLRMYYVSDGLDTRSAVSKDDGLTWTRDGGTRVYNGVDPMVARLSPERYVMFYTDFALQTRTRQLFFANSTDGLNFTVQSQPVVSATGQNTVVDPFVIMAAGNRMRLYFSVMTGQTSQSIYTCLLPASYSADNCASTLSADLKLHVPVVDYAGAFYRADFAQSPSQDGSLTFTITSAGAIADAAPYATCGHCTLDASLKLYIPVVYYGNTSYRATLQGIISSAGTPSFKVSDAGVNQ